MLYEVITLMEAGLVRKVSGLPGLGFTVLFLASTRSLNDRFDLRKDIDFDTTVTSAKFDAASARWRVESSTGERVDARYLSYNFV